MGTSSGLESQSYTIRPGRKAERSEIWQEFDLTINARPVDRLVAGFFTIRQTSKLQSTLRPYNECSMMRGARDLDFGKTPEAIYRFTAAAPDPGSRERSESPSADGFGDRAESAITPMMRYVIMRFTSAM